MQGNYQLLEPILRDMFLRHQNQISEISLSLLDIPNFKEPYKNYPPHVQQLFDALFNENNCSIVLLDHINHKTQKTQMPICNKLFHPREKIYRCFDCLIHESAVYCSTCFHNSNHKGHSFEDTLSGGGNCDCGNNQALKYFCKDHSGQETAYPVTQQETQKFNDYFQNLLDWSQQLVQKFQKQNFGFFLLFSTLSILQKFNIQSLFYNTLTHQMLFKNQGTIIDFIFRVGVRKIEIGKAATNMFLSMFSIFDFKLQLTIAFVRNYNKLVGFDASSFTNLYIQLFANDNVLAKMFDMKEELSPKQKIVIDPRGRHYPIDLYYGHLEFMCSVSFSSSIRFFKELFSEIKCVELPKLNTILTEVQNGDNKIENYVSLSLEIENSFYYLMKQIIKKLSKDKQFLAELIRNYIQAIQYFKFIKNKTVLLPQRIFGILVFAYSECSPETISIEKMIEITNLSKQELKILLLKISNQIIHCFQDWSLSMLRQNFFLNYVSMYANSGQKVVVLDYLTLRICAILLSKLGNPTALGEQIERIFQNQIEDLKANPPTQQSEYVQFCQKWAKTVNILVEISISNRCETVVASKLDSRSPRTFANKMELIKSLFFLKKQIAHQQLKQLSYVLYGSKMENDSELILQISTFDAGRRKFIIHQGIQADPLMFEYLESVKNTAISKHFAMTKQLFQKVRLNEGIVFYRDVFLSSLFIQRIISHFQLLIYSIKDKNLISSMAYTCLDMNKRLSSLCSGEIKIFEHFYSKVEEKIINEDILEQLKNKFGLNLKKESQQKSQKEYQKETQDDILQKKREEKKQKRRRQHAQSAKAALEHNITAVKEAFEEQTCIICSEVGDSINQLYHLTFMGFSNNMQAMFHQKGYNLYFIGCEHLFHYKCIDLSKINQLLVCPLCNSTNNCFFPAGRIIKNDQIVPKIHSIITKIHAHFIQPEAEKSIPDISLFDKMFLYLVEFVVFSRLKHTPVTEMEIKNIKIVCLMIKNYILRISEEDLKLECENISNYTLKYSSQSTAKCQFYFQKFTIELLLKWLTVDVITEVNFEDYLKFVNLQDLMAAVHLVNIITDNNLRMPQNFMEAEGMPKISELNVFCTPPKTIADLLELRDSAPICTRAEYHQMKYCLFCKEFFCYECKEVITHTRYFHFGSTIFLSVNDGSYLETAKNMIVASSSLYLDELGGVWTPGKVIEGYRLNEQEYRLKVLKIQTHSR